MKKRFENLDGIATRLSMKDMLKWNKERRSKKKDLQTRIAQADTKQIRELQTNHSSSSITWIGHSTFLIQMKGLNILTDPVWAKWMGTQKRHTEPGIELADLPNIDHVVISHSHYDHLDFPTIRRIIGNPAFYVPHGLKKLFVKKGFPNTHEANWWESFTLDDVKLTFVPAQHWTRRRIFDMNTSHWGGWIIEDQDSDHTVYFVGDTGYFRGFKNIAEQFNPKYVLMPIGAYEPEWCMKLSHINPEDAVKAFLELSGEFFIPMHYGAYRLADDTGPEALERLEREWNRLNLPVDKLQKLKIGETLWCNPMLIEE